MSDKIEFSIDGKKVQGSKGQTIMEAADENGIYIPRLCFMKGLTPHGSCRVCTCVVNGRMQTACTQPIAPDIVVENDTEQLQAIRRSIIDMLFVEGNHFCMFCEKSGNCELQAVAYRLGIVTPQHPYLFPERKVDASHPDIIVDKNRCILCSRCLQAAEQIDGKQVFGAVGRGGERSLAVNSPEGLGGTSITASDRAAEVCPVGALMKKRVGYAVPIGQRKFDHKPIGSEIEQKRQDLK